MRRNNNEKKALKSGIWYTVSNFLVKSIGFITTPIFTRLLTKADFGNYNNYTSWLAIATVLITLNLESTLISARFDHKDDFDGYIFSILSLSTLSALVWLAIVNLFSAQASEFLGMDIVYVNAMLIYLVFVPAVNLYQCRERYYYEYKKTVAISLLISVGTALLSVLLVYSFPDKLSGRIIGSIVPTVLLGILFYIYFIRKGKHIKLEYWKYALPICLPYIPHLLSMSLLNSMDRVMITRICGADQTALYSLAYTCGSMVTLLLTSLNGAFTPWLGDKLNQKEYAQVKKFSYLYVGLFFYLAIGIMLISPEVLYILGGKNYLEAIYVLAPVSMGCVFQFLYTMYVNIEQFNKKTIGMAIGSAIAACSNYILNLLLIPQIGYLAAAYTTLAGYLILLIIHIYLVKRLGMLGVYDDKFICGLAVVGILIMIAIVWMYSHTVIRYGTIAVYGIVFIYLFVKNRRLIKDLLIGR